MLTHGSNDRDHYANPRVTGEVRDTEADFAPDGGRQEHVPASVCSPGVSVGSSNISRPPTAVGVAREPRVVWGGSGHNTGCPLGDDPGVGRYIDSSQRSNQPCLLGGVDGKDCGALAAGIEARGTPYG